MRNLHILHIATLLFMVSVSTAWSAIYYISPTGSDRNSGADTTHAWATFLHAEPLLSPGDTLIIMDGTYNQKIIPKHGGTEAGGYISYIAQHPYQVTLAPTTDTGQATIEVFSCPGCGGGHDAPVMGYLKFEGLIVRGVSGNDAMALMSSDTATVSEMTHHIIVRKCGFFGGVQEDNSSALALGNNLRDSLVEDVFSYGFGRKAAEAFGCLRVTIRRAVFRYDYWEGDDYKPNDPRTAFSGYNTQDSIFENIIAIDLALNPPGYEGELAAFAASGNETPAAISGSERNKYLGLVVLNNNGNGVDIDGGSGGPNVDLVFKNIVSWNCKDGGDGLAVQGNDNGSSYSYLTLGNNAGSGFRLAPNPHAPITNEIVTNNFSTHNRINGYVYANSQVASFTNNSSTLSSDMDDHPDFEPQYAPDISQRFLDPVMVAGHERGARIVNRYVDGILTTTPLWPWPDEDIIKQHMCSPADLALVHRGDSHDALFVGRPGWCDTDKTLTEYIWEFNGATCPADICTGKSVAPNITSIFLSD